jgi:hypothetical protein
MNGPQHYAAAEDLLGKSNTVSIDDGWAPLVAQQAQIHATLALAAATAAAASLDDVQHHDGGPDSPLSWRSALGS